MGTEDLILDLELLSNIFQTQIHNLRMARECVIEGQQPVKKPNIDVGDLVLVRDHTSKCFMPKYKVNFRVVHIQLPDVNAFGRKGRLSFNPKNVKDLDWVPNDWTHKFNLDHVKDITGTAWDMPKQ